MFDFMIDTALFLVVPGFWLVADDVLCTVEVRTTVEMVRLVLLSWSDT